MWQTVRQIILISVVSTCTGLFANAIRWDSNNDGEPNRLALITPPKPELAANEIISLDDARTLWETQMGIAFFLDARGPEDYRRGHIAMAHNLPAHDFEEHLPAIQPFLMPDTPIVVYCDGTECDTSHQVAKKLTALGFNNVRILVNGWTVWNKAGLPAQRGEQP